MNHGGMDHGGGGMDHGGGGMDHGGGGMDHGKMCSMNMLWNTQIADTCVVFPGWHIRNNFDFFLSFLAIIALSVFYEWLRQAQKTVDVRIARSLEQHAKGKGRTRSRSGSRSPSSSEDAGLLSGRKGSFWIAVPVPARVIRASLYGATVFLSFFLMLVFMTYNAYLILAVVLGASVGHYVFGGYLDVQTILSGGGADGKGMACH